jgi:hypothetical protein
MSRAPYPVNSDTASVNIVRSDSAFIADSIRLSGNYSGMLVTRYSDIGGNHSIDTSFNSHYILTLLDTNTLLINWRNNTAIDTVPRQSSTVDSSKHPDIWFSGWANNTQSPLVFNVYYYKQSDSVYVNIFTTWSNSHTNYDFFGKK